MSAQSLRDEVDDFHQQFFCCFQRAPLIPSHLMSRKSIEQVVQTPYQFIAGRLQSGRLVASRTGSGRGRSVDGLAIAIQFASEFVKVHGVGIRRVQLVGVVRPKSCSTTPTSSSGTNGFEM